MRLHQIVEHPIWEQAGVGMSLPLSIVARCPLDFSREIPARLVHVRLGSILSCSKMEVSYSEEGRENGNGIGMHFEK